MAADPIIYEKVQQAISLLQSQNVDAWLIIGQEGPGPDPTFPLLMGERDLGGGCLLLTRQGRRIAIVNGLDAALPESTGVWDEIIIYPRNYWDTLRETLEAINPAQIAVNYSQSSVVADGLTYGKYLQLMKTFESSPLGRRFISAEKLVSALRSRKSPAEVRAIKAAIAQTDMLFDRLRAYMKPGMTGREMFDFLQRQIMTAGLGFGWSQFNDPILTVGPVPYMGHTPPPEGIVWEKGQLLQIDMGVRHQGYCSDFQRMFYALRDDEDTPPPPVCAFFDLVHQGISDMIAAIRPGVRNDYPSSLGFTRIANAGYPEPQFSAGHQLGRNVHDGGVGLAHFRRPVDCLIEEGNVFTVEGLESRMADVGWMSLEEDVLVTATGCEILTTRQNNLYLIRG